jgi:ferredoxin
VPTVTETVTVTVRPSGLEFPVGAGETVMAAAERSGLIWPTTCHGIGDCRTCVMYVIDEMERVAPPSDFERAALQSISFSMQGDKERWRLACQTQVIADVAVRKPGVRQAV